MQSNFDCPVCGLAEKDIPFYGFSHCNHPICGVCAIKLQKFSKEKGNDLDYSKCVICKQDISKIIISTKIRSFEDFNANQLLSQTEYGLLFESKDAQQFFDSTIKISCPKCHKTFKILEELIAHVDEHKKRYCELCTSFNKCLISELEIFTDNDYHQHRCRTHPKCKFCDIRFYDDSCLIKHVKDAHFICDICHRNHGYVAYRTQNELLTHYNKDHFVCEICRSVNNINVFESEYALKTHKVSAHAHNLINEGLVSVGYGDRDNMRYGARRRARDVNEDCMETCPTNVPQIIPTMNCEHEFPRLGAEGSIPLGVPHLSSDDNDARTAFLPTKTEDDDNNNVKKPLATNQPLNQDKMSNNFAISVKKSAGDLNSDDFPTLSTGGGSRPSHVQPFAKVKNVVSHNAVTKSHAFPTDKDFPSLSSGPNKAPVTKSWKVAMKPGNVVGPPRNVVQQVSRPPPQTSRIDLFDEGGDLDVKKEIVEVPKVSLMSREQFEQMNGKSRNVAYQTMPDEKDFPSLGNPSMGQQQGSTKVGAWGKYSVHGNDNGAKKKTGPVNEPKLAVQSMDDFPDLPFKPLPKDCNKSKKKSKKKPDFASTIVSAPPTESQQIKMKTTQTTNGSKPATPKFDPAPAPTCHGSKPATSPQPTCHGPKPPLSLKGIDYIPSVAPPTKDPITMVDSKQFSIIKSVNDHINHNGDQTCFSLSCESDFPSVVGGGTINAGGPSDNRFNVLHDSTIAGAVTTTTNKKPNKPPTKQAPAISSESDFPSLSSHKPKPTTTQPVKQPKKEVAVVNCSKPVEDVIPDKPVMSLMDVAMSVAKKTYTPFADADERNHNMFVLVYDSLESDLATEFLKLSNLYRNRKLSVQDYLDSLNTKFVENLAFISTMLPQMCVLLPDIPLQRSLMSSMPKGWIKDLRECMKCDQVVHKADLVEHNQLAH